MGVEPTDCCTTIVASVSCQTSPCIRDRELPYASDCCLVAPDLLLDELADAAVLRASVGKFAATTVLLYVIYSSLCFYLFLLYVPRLRPCGRHDEGVTTARYPKTYSITDLSRILLRTYDY